MSNTLSKKIFALAFASTAVAAVSSSCAPNDSALFIRGVIAATPPQCIVEADPSTVMLGQGTLDREFRDSYVGSLLVGNQLVRRGSKDQLRTETSRVRLEGAVVSVATAGGAPIRSFSTIGTGFVDPGDGSEPGYGIFDATLVPPQTGNVGEVVNVTVRVYGTTLGGEDIESGDISFPVYICQGCLIRYPAEAADPTATGYQCLIGAEASIDSPCRLGQDDPVDCRLCSDHPICVTPP
jgi:hypothetical protein